MHSAVSEDLPPSISTHRIVPSLIPRRWPMLSGNTSLVYPAHFQWTGASRSFLQQLKELGFSVNLLAFVRNFPRGRSFQVIIGNHSSRTFAEETGVPQGSLLAVTLFLAAMNGVFRSLPANIYIYVYADDILLIVVGDTPGRKRIKAQSATSAVSVGLTQQVLL